eukprot:scaffold36743_cov65-Phaeocystis_antarctica.AAC.4
MSTAAHGSSADASPRAGEEQAKQRTRAASEGLRRSRKVSEGLDGLELQSEGSLCEGGVEGAVVLELGECELQRVNAGSVELLAWLGGRGRVRVSSFLPG